MDFIEKIQDLAQRIPKQIDHIETEEATKSAFIMPFIQTLGYDVFNPLEVVPEFTADVGTKRGEKADYAIKMEDKPVMLMECKWCGSDLDQCHASQLYRYFSVTEARFGILTNGVYYKFFSDLDQMNVMDNKPFFEFDFLDFDDNKVEELKKFSKSAFDLDNILTTASELKYTNSLRKIFIEELNNPTAQFVKFFASQAYSGKMTQKAVDQFTPIVKRALNGIIRDKVNERLNKALDVEQEDVAQEEAIAEEAEEEMKGGVVTTDEEVEGFNIIKAIVREVVDVKRVFMRDTKSYFGILLDDNNRKPICRLHFNASQKYLGVLKDKGEDRIPIDDLDEIFKYADRIKETCKEYL
jgi:predicted type IV restriction endonuclease